MARSVVFKTQGKLDLRSIMTFGLNSKPNTGHPIGRFGTGLKYAIAVLTRHKIPVTLYIDQQKWSVSTEDSIFRDKTVTEVFLERHRKLLPPAIRKLPFTTELGRDWELWQAFRELESNTRDEMGETFLVNKDGDHMHSQDPFVRDFKGSTWIVVEGEAFVQEYLDRGKTFLPDGLTLQESTDSVQIFDRPSAHIYYRSIRVMDLKDDERSQLTYNILRPIELTEDRTAKSKWDVQYYIQEAVAQLKDKNRIEKVITAPARSFEGTMSYYAAPTKEFLDTADTLKDKLNSTAKVAHEQYRPPKAKAASTFDWLAPIIKAVKAGDWDEVEAAIQPYRKEFEDLLDAAHSSTLYQESIKHAPTQETGDVQEAHETQNQGRVAAGSISEDDDLPF